VVGRLPFRYAPKRPTTGKVRVAREQNPAHLVAEAVSAIACGCFRQFGEPLCSSGSGEYELRHFPVESVELNVIDTALFRRDFSVILMGV
jgi:hypothetical protein